MTEKEQAPYAAAGQRFETACARLGWRTDDQIAQALGVSNRTVFALRQGARLPSPEVVLGLLEREIDIGYIFTGNDTTGKLQEKLGALVIENTRLKTTLESVRAILATLDLPAASAPAPLAVDGLSATERQIIERMRESDHHMTTFISDLLAINKSGGAKAASL